MDLGSEIRDPEKTYSGSRIQGSKRHRILDPGSATLQKNQLKNVKSLVLYVGHKVLFSIVGQWALTSKLMPLARHVTFQ